MPLWRTRIISNDALGIDGVGNTGRQATSAIGAGVFPVCCGGWVQLRQQSELQTVPWKALRWCVLTDAAWDPRPVLTFGGRDLSGDCGVDLVDAGIVARQWPAVDLLAAVAEHWLDVYVWPEPSTQNSVPAASGHKRFAFER